MIDKVLGNPLVGLSPWIVYSIVEGEGRLEVSAGLALAVAFVILLLNWSRGSKPKALEFADVAFFSILMVVVALASDSTHHWLELWGGEVANIVLAVFVVGSILVGHPFTLAYAKEDAPEEEWSDPHFIRANYIISGVWAVAFLIEAASGFYGDAVLDNSNNIWTGWIIQTLPLIAAAQFTIWWPSRLEALGKQAGGEAVRVPPIDELYVQMTPWIIVIGVLVLTVGGGPGWLGVAFIIVGSVSTHLFAERIRRDEAKQAPELARAPSV